MAKAVDTERKLAVVLACLAGETGPTKAARELGVPHSLVNEWISRYRMEGPAGLTRSAQRRVYSDELKRQAVETYLESGESLQAVCERYQIRCRRQLREWVELYQQGLPFSTSPVGKPHQLGKKTSLETRLRVVRACLDGGLDYGAVAKAYGVSYQQAYLWTKKYSQNGEAALIDRRGRPRTGIKNEK